MTESITHLHVFARSAGATTGWLVLGHVAYPCSLGRTGRRHLKREGDGATPVGAWALLPGYYRADRGTRPVTGLALNPSRRGEAWCDDPHSGRYNTKIKVAETGAVESFWRGDAVYDVVFPTNHNTRPRIKGAGSAIFFHLARARGVATAGCVAVAAEDMRKILLRTGRKALIIVRPPEGWPLRAPQK